MVLPNEAIVFDKRFKIVSVIGRGSKTVVYHARVGSLNEQDVALKVLFGRSAKSSNYSRLLNEANTLLAAQHESVLEIFGFHALGDHTYIALEFAPYGNLLQYIQKRGGKLSSQKAIQFLKQNLQGLKFIHSKNIVHRDIKPENLLVTREDVVKIGDFGAAYTESGTAREHSDFTPAVGTMSYMSPEILEGGKSSHMGDLYALAVSYYQLVTGIQPFENIPLVEQIERRQTLQIPPLQTHAPDLDPGLASFLMKNLSYDPSQRDQSAEEMLHHLRSTLVETADSNFESSMEFPMGSSRVDTLERRKPDDGIKEKVTQPSETIMDEQKKHTEDDTLTGTGTQETAPSSPPPAPPRSAAVELNKPLRQDILNAALEEKTGTADIPQEVVERFRIDEALSELQKQKNSPAGDAMTIDISSRIAEMQNKGSNHKKQKKKRASRSEQPLIDQEQRRAKAASRRPPKKKRSFLKTLFLLLVCVVLSAGAAAGWFLYTSSPEGLSTEVSKLKEKIIDTASDSLTRITRSEPEIPVEDTNAEGVIPLEQENTGDEDGVMAESVEDEMAPAPEEESNDLRRGTYAGRLQALFPQGDVSLNFLVLSDLSKMAIIVGIEGWTPQLVEIPGPEDVVRVASNGLVLQFSGTFASDEMKGTVENMLNGETGIWETSPTDK